MPQYDGADVELMLRFLPLVFLAGCESFQLASELGLPSDTGAHDAMADSSVVETTASDSTSSDTTTSDDTAVGADSTSVDTGSLVDTATGEVPCKCGEAGCCPGVDVKDCCAGAKCPIKHDTGAAVSYWFCGPLGVPGNAATYTKEMALKAAATWRAATTLSDYPCSGTNSVVNNPATGSDPTATWTYGGSYAGRVYVIVGGVFCPGAAQPTWN